MFYMFACGQALHFFSKVAIQLLKKRDNNVQLFSPVPTAVVSVRLEVALLIRPLAVRAVVGVYQVVSLAPLHLQFQVPLKSQTCLAREETLRSQFFQASDAQ